MTPTNSNPTQFAVSLSVPAAWPTASQSLSLPWWHRIPAHLSLQSHTHSQLVVKSQSVQDCNDVAARCRLVTI